jgi:putative spermidine/putrescine transport system permease protein
VSASRSQTERLGKGDAPRARPPVRAISWAWLGLLPFFLFALAFLILPSTSIVYRSFQGLAETLYLKDPSRDVVDTAGLSGQWAAGGRGVSMERRGGNDAAVNWSAFAGTGGVGHDAEGNPIGGTPGEANSAAPVASPTSPSPTPGGQPRREGSYPPRSVLINEVAWGGTEASAAGEWIELFNTTTADIDLTGWTLADGNDIQIDLAGTIPAGGYFLLERGDDTTIADIPANQIYSGALRDGGLTLDNFTELLGRRDLMRSYQASLTISLITALGGGLFGFLLAYAVILGGLPKGVRTFMVTFSGVASNFAGVPLAFAFMSTLGQMGLITRAINSLLDTNIYLAGFSIYNIWGLSIVYMYFQFPLMVLVMAPALDGLRREWREAAENLGGTTWQYWRHVALPILMPSLLGAMILLFGNSFGAYATAYAFAGSRINLVTIVIGGQITGEALFNPGLGNALALGMVVVMAVCMAGYAATQRRAARWMR